MNEILSAIQEHLNRQLTTSQLDYYQVIGLEPFCSDKNQIEQALRAAQAALRDSENSQKEKTAERSNSLQVVHKLLRQAQAILLDSTKKTAYDSQLAKLFESQKKQRELGKPVSATTASIGILAKTASNRGSEKQQPPAVSNEAELLPTGDPMQPFLIASANQTAWGNPNHTLTNLSVEKRRNELAELFPSLLLMAHPAQPQTEQPPAWLVAADRKPAKSTAAITAANSIAASPPSPSTSEPVSKPIDLVEQLKKRRRRRSLLAVGSMILVSVGLLGFASFRFISNRMQVAQQDKKTDRQPTQAAGEGNQNQPTSGSKQPELVIAPNKGRKGKSNPDQPLPELPTLNREPNPNDPAMSMPAATPQPDPAAAMPSDPKPDPKPELEPKPQPEPPPEPPPSSESVQWKSSMTQARELLVKGELAKFEPLMTKLLDQAVTKTGKEQTQRLDQAGQLYKIYVESFQEAKKKAKGTSSLKVGNTEVSIVEATPEKLVVRAGENKTYEWDKLPFGMAVAISDLGLSESSPVDMAARAIFFSLNPFYQESAKANNLITKRIEGWLDRAAGKDSIRADIKQFLTDKYE